MASLRCPPISRAFPTPIRRRRKEAIWLAYQGTFDGLNPYNLSAGSTAQGLVGNVFQSLMLRSLDEPFTLYGLIAQSIETDDARSYVIFHLDPRARFSDGAPVS